MVGGFHALYYGIFGQWTERESHICIVYHHLTNNIGYFRSLVHKIIKVIKLFEN